MEQFTDLGFAEPISRALKQEKLTHPTPIQARVIPAMMKGKDILGTAQTGTGKTAAFLLPILQMLAVDNRRASRTTCRALILVPTRELANQVMANVRALSRYMSLSTALIVGGARPGPQKKAFAAGVDIAVATPGRLEDLMRGGAVSLHETEMVVLDEADQMLDMGFIPAIRRIIEAMPQERHTVMLSATMSKPIRALAHAFLTAPHEVSVDPASQPALRIEQKVQYVKGSEKRAELIKLMSCDTVERAIIFTRTKRGADKLGKHLSQSGLGCETIHGDKNQGQRERALKAFRNGRATILVATDVAARGIHIENVSHVVNFDLPLMPEAYVHRIGRTGRAGKSGISISLCSPDEYGLLRDIEKLIGRAIPAEGEPAPEQNPRFKQKPNAHKRNGAGRHAKSRRRPDAAGPRKSNKPRRPNKKAYAGERRASASA